MPHFIEVAVMEFVVNGNLWRIFEVSPHNPNLRRAEGGFALGMCDNNKKCIFINETVSNEKYRHIITHELCHCFCFEYGICIPEQYEEVLCNFVADYGKDILEIANMIIDLINILEVA